MSQKQIEESKKLIRISTVPTSLNTFLKGQLQMLSAHYEVLAVSSPGKALDELAEREGVRVAAVPMERHISVIKDFLSLCRLIVLFARERPYIVHSMTPKAGLLAMVAAWITRVPVRMHTFTGLIFPTATGLMQRLLIMMDRITCFCATYINPEGEGVKRDLERFHVTSKALHVIANGNVRGLDLSYYDRNREVMEIARTIKTEGIFTFCFVGRLVKDKGINELISAFVRLYAKYEDVHLILVGNCEEKLDPLKPETMERILSHPGIVYAGRQKDVRPYLVVSDAFVFPSYREGFPNVVLEAGAMGLPSIVTDINGCNEIIIDGQNGVIVPPRDEDALYLSMKHFVEEPAEVERMARNARPLIVSRYDRQMVWNALLEEYQYLCGTLAEKALYKNPIPIKVLTLRC